MGNTALPAIPLAFVSSELGSNQTSGATAGTWTTLTFTDDTSFLNSKIDRPTSSRFRALVDGYYKFTYSMTAIPTTNNRGWQFRLFKNGTTQLAPSLTRGNSSNNTAARGGDNVSFSGIYLLSINDYIEVQINPTDNDIITVLTESSALFELIKPT